MSKNPINSQTVQLQARPRTSVVLENQESKQWRCYQVWLKKSDHPSTGFLLLSNSRGQSLDQEMVPSRSKKILKSQEQQKCFMKTWQSDAKHTKQQQCNSQMLANNQHFTYIFMSAFLKIHTYLLDYFKGRVIEKEREAKAESEERLGVRERAGSLPRCSQWLGQGQAESRNMEFHQGLSHDCN